MMAPKAPYMAKTDKERLATGFWNRIESNQATDCNIGWIFLRIFDHCNQPSVSSLLRDQSEALSRIFNALFKSKSIPKMCKEGSRVNQNCIHM